MRVQVAGGAGQRGQLAFVDDQDVDVGQQLGRQGLRRRGVQHHRYALGLGCVGVGRHGGQGGFERHQQMAEASQSWQPGGREVRRCQALVSAGCDGDGVFGVVRHTNEGGAASLVCHTHCMQNYPSGRERGLDGHGIGVCAQRRQHVGSDAASAGTGCGLVRALATRVSFEIAAQHRLARAGNVRCPHHEI